MFRDKGGWLSWLERAVHIREVIGSTPIPPTRRLNRGASRGSLITVRNCVSESPQPVRASPSTHVDILLFQIRWIVGLIAFPIAWLESGNRPIESNLISWFIVLALANLAYGIILRFTPHAAKWIPVPSLILDMFMLGLLPFLIENHTNLLDLLLIFPALVGAVRFGPQVGLIVAAIMSLFMIVNAALSFGSQASVNLFSRTLPIVGTFGGVVIVGFLSKREKEAAVREAVGELDELRGVVAGAKLLYQTTDLFSLTTSYKPVLESMLEAGVKGLPEARREDGHPIGIALFFDDQDPEKSLRVVASRNLDSRDENRTLPGRTGLVAQALQAGHAAVTDHVNTDQELGAFESLAQCRCCVCYPLQSGLEQYGIVVLASPAPRRPSQQHLDLMRAFTSQAGIAFQNARLYQITRKEQDRIIRTDTEVRAKLARDLHDGPTQKVAGLVMQLEFIGKLLDTDVPEAKREIEKARSTAQQTAKEIRTALFTLRPLALESKGLSAALEQYGERLRETENVPITIEPGKFNSELDMNTGATIFAIIEEAIGNARKHANNTPITVTVIRQNQTLIATVQDQGPGFDVNHVSNSYDRRGSLGLQNMRERAILINSELRIESGVGRGTRVTLIVPLTANTPFGNSQ
jgi:signal transduction histidine kinase